MFFLLSPSMIRGNWKSLFSSAGPCCLARSLKSVNHDLKEGDQCLSISLHYISSGGALWLQRSCCLSFLFPNLWTYCLITVTSELHPIFNISNYKKFSTAISLWWWEDLSRLELSRIWADFHDMWPREEPNMIISSPFFTFTKSTSVFFIFTLGSGNSLSFHVIQSGLKLGPWTVLNSSGAQT